MDEKQLDEFYSAKNQWLDSQYTPEELFNRERIYKESKKALSEIPLLIEFVDQLFPTNEEFEGRLKEYGRKLGEIQASNNTK